MIVDVEPLNTKLYKLFVAELMDMNIGYTHNKSRLREMIDLVHMIDYIKHGNHSKEEIQKILNIYA